MRSSRVDSPVKWSMEFHPKSSSSEHNKHVTLGQLPQSGKIQESYSYGRVDYPVQVAEGKKKQDVEIADD